VGELDTSRDGLVERSCDDVVGFPRIGRKSDLPPGHDLLLGPLVRLTEMIVKLEVDSSPKLLNRRGRERFEKVIKCEFKRVTLDEYHLVILKSFCIVFQGLLLFRRGRDITWARRVCAQKPFRL
jgi:hypothetical protein